MTASRWATITAIGLVVVVVAATGGIVAATGLDVGGAVAALIRGAVGSWYAFSSGTLVRSTPLILTGLAVAVAFRAGVFNIGAEGQFLAGAAAGTAVALVAHGASSHLAVVGVLAAGAIAGAVWAGVAAILRARFHVLEVISTIMLNFVAADLVAYLVRGPLQEPTHIYPQTQSIADAARLPHLGTTTRLHVGFLIAVLACAASGFRLRVAGANPYAARVAGQIDVDRVTTKAFLISGGFAGLAGAIEVAGVTYALYENISPGYGYTAIAVALLARLNPGAVIATGILFGALESGAAAMQRDAGVPSVLVSVIEAGIILALVALERLRTRGVVAAA